MDYCVQTASGIVRGYVDGGILQFHGIPYAAPPTGQRRFRMPEPPVPWSGVLDATRRGCVSPQDPSDLDKPMGPVTLPQGEDCLTLAVSTPSTEEKLPVAVWFHGGANCYCGGDLPWYDGAALARSQHVVVVNVNFRLGVFGFLCAEGVADRALSIEDQMLALHWVQENIQRFGGDPRRVTVFGQSAGANAIAHILSREDSQGLFQQIVLESASLGRGNHLLEDAYEVGRAVLANLNIPPEAPDLLTRLQSLSVEELLRAARQVPEDIKARHQGMYFKPVMDAWHTPEQTAHQAAKMAVKRQIRVMIGFTREETHAFSTARDPSSLAALRRGQFLRYDLPGVLFAREAAGGGCPVWKYQFDWAAPDSIFGACHCLELPFLFGNLDSWDAPFLAGGNRGEMEHLTAVIQDIWGRFFRGETPAEDWPRYMAADWQIKHLDGQANPVGTEPQYNVQ